MRRAVVFPSLFCLAAAPSLAGPPLETDDPDTPGPNRWEINLSSPFVTRDQTWLFQPLLDINYGVGDRVQLKLKPRAVVLDGRTIHESRGEGPAVFGYLGLQFAF